MARDPDIDKLLEEGLGKYGAGDLDGALAAWESVLEREPHNDQAKGYLEYVRGHYETLAQRAPAGGMPSLTDQDDLEVELEVTSEEPEQTIELEADEPAELPNGTETGLEGETDFGTTREFRDERPADFDGDEERTKSFRGEESKTEARGDEERRGEVRRGEVIDSFQHEGTPVNFDGVTSIKERDLGFVQPAADPQPRPRTPSSQVSIGQAPTVDLASAGALQDAPRKTTKDMPEQTRRPAKPTAKVPAIDPSAVSQAEVLLPSAPTRELERSPADVAAEHDISISAPTRDLGLRPARAPTSDDSPTREADVRAFREKHAASAQTPTDPIEVRAAAVLAEVDEGAPAVETTEERTRRRITGLMERANAWAVSGQLEKAAAAADLAMSEEPESPLAQKLIHRNRDAITLVFQTFCGPPEHCPVLARPWPELSQDTAISPRAAFLLSRIDGTLTLEEILDVSGMPRLEAYRYLCQLFLREILK